MAKRVKGPSVHARAGQPKGDPRDVKALEVMKNGAVRPLTYYNGNAMGEVRWVSGRFLLSLQECWEEHGTDVLNRVAATHPELLLMAMCKISAVNRVEVGQPGDFSGLKTKEQIVERLEEQAGPEARRLFESFIKKVDALKEGNGGG